MFSNSKQTIITNIVGYGIHVKMSCDESGVTNKQNKFQRIMIAFVAKIGVKTGS